MGRSTSGSRGLGRTLTRPGVAEDLASVSVHDAFSIWSLFVAGPSELEGYGAGAEVLTDDTMRLEFSTPRELHNRHAGGNVATLTALAAGAAAPCRHSARAGRGRRHGVAQSGQMMAAGRRPRAGAGRFPRRARAGCDRRGVARRLRAGRGDHGPVPPMRWPGSASSPRRSLSRPPRRACSWRSRSCRPRQARGTTRWRAHDAPPEVAATDPAGFEQLASLLADAGDTVRLDQAVDGCGTRARSRRRRCTTRPSRSCCMATCRRP